MRIEAIRPGMSPIESGSQGGTGVEVRSFKDTIKEAISKVNKMQLKADEMSVNFALGKVENTHEVMIAIEEARLALQFLVEVRNRLVEAYQEIMRMQV
jgi:flagellar hook-basal body complex protein FliE